VYFWSTFKKSYRMFLSCSIRVDFGMTVEVRAPGIRMSELLITPGSPGLEFVTQLSTEDDERAALLLTIHDRYYALQAVCAVFRYIESTFSTIYPPHTLVIKYRPIEGERQVFRSFKVLTRYSPGSMLIDTETARNLELLEGVSKQKTHSLFGSVQQFSPPLSRRLMLRDRLLNSTFTPQGTRLLRTTILCPMTSLDAIDARLSAVSELVQSEETFHAIRDALKGVQKVDLDKLIIQLAALDQRREAIENTVKTAYDRMGQLLDLQKIIRNIPAVGRATGDCACILLRVIGEVHAVGLSLRYDVLITLYTVGF
jgi:DNA mismatch repair protein MSH4